MLVARPVTYALSGLFLDLYGWLQEAYVSTQDPGELFWSLCRRTCGQVCKQLGGGLSTALGVFLRPHEVPIIMERRDSPELSMALWPTDASTLILRPTHLTGPRTTMGARGNLNMEFFVHHDHTLPDGNSPEKKV
jgi:hypothetical protein